MGWNTEIAVVRDATLDDLATAGLRPAGDAIAAEEAAVAAGACLFGCQLDGDVALFGTSTQVPRDLEALLVQALGTEVVAAGLWSAGDTYEWSVTAPGERRVLISTRGQTVHDEGRPLPEEIVAARLDEATALDLLRIRSGFEIDGRWHSAPAYRLGYGERRPPLLQRILGRAWPVTPCPGGAAPRRSRRGRCPRRGVRRP